MEDRLKVRPAFEYVDDKKKDQILITEIAFDSDYALSTPGRVDPVTDEGNEPIPKSLENPRIVASSRKRDALFYGIVYHCPAVLATAFLTIVYVQQWRWPYPGPSDEAEAALQFAAKFHECLLIVSLSNILFHRIRYLLLRSEGVPLGLLTTPFQLNNPLFFISSEFLGSLRRLFSALSNFLTFGLVASIALLSFAASPFSAVVLLPRSLTLALPESHYVMRTLFEKEISPVPDADGYYLVETLPMPVDRLFPTSIGPELGVTWSCPSLSGRPGNCVSFFQDMFPDILANGLTMYSRNDETIRMSADPNGILIDGGTRSVMSISTFNCPIETTTLAPPSFDILLRVTCPLWTSIIELGMVRGKIWSAIAPEGSPKDYPLVATLGTSANNQTLPILQPQVIAQKCDRYINHDMLSIEYLTSFGWGVEGEVLSSALCFGTGLFPAFNFTMDEQLATLLLKQDWVRGFLLFVDLQDHVPYPISGGYISVAPMPQTDVNLNTGLPELQKVGIGYFIAQWAEASPSNVPSITDEVEEVGVLPGELRRPLYDFLNMTAETVGPIVRMDAVWLNSLDIYPFEIVATGGFPRLDNNSRSLFGHVAASGDMIPIFLAAVMSAAQGSYGVIPPAEVMCVAPGHSACIWPDDEGTAPIQYGFANAVPEAELDLPDNQVQMRVKIEQNTWGYAFDGVTIILAFIFLYLHVGLVLVHLAIIAIGRWSSTAWPNLTDFVVLGIGSSSSDLLKNAGAGVRSWRTWSYMTSVRSVKREERLELVVCDPDRDEYVGLLGREKAGSNVKYS